MIDDAQIQRYREMSLDDRWDEVRALTRLAMAFLAELPAREVQRRFELDWAAKDAADQRMLDHLRKHR